MTDVNTTIYHYTGADSFVAILKTRQLWVTDIAAMNDSTEKLDFLTRFKSRLQECNFQNPCVQREVKGMVDFVEGGNFGVLCFSTDGDLLPQWISYGDKGSGYSIGFKAENLEKTLKRKDLGWTIILRDLGNIFTTEIVYEEDNKNLLLSSLIERCRNKEPRRARWDTSFDSLRHQILKHACSFKNSCFKEENEVRLVKWFRDYHANDSALYEEGFLASHYDHRSVSGIPRLYYKHDFDPHWVHEIVLGPKCPARDTEVKKFLNELGYPKEIKIRRSSATYR